MFSIRQYGIKDRPRSPAKAEAIISRQERRCLAMAQLLHFVVVVLFQLIKNLVLLGLIKGLCSQHHRATSNKFCFIFPRVEFASRAITERSNFESSV